MVLQVQRREAWGEGSHVREEELGASGGEPRSSVIQSWPMTLCPEPQAQERDAKMEESVVEVSVLG